MRVMEQFSIEFGVIKRSLKTISVQLNFSNGSALCKLLSTQWLHLLLVWGDKTWLSGKRNRLVFFGRSFYK